LGGGGVVQHGWSPEDYTIGITNACYAFNRSVFMHCQDDVCVYTYVYMHTCIFVFSQLV
jgi:hypothetical protein